MSHNLFDSLQTFNYGAGKTGKYHSLPALEKAGLGKISRLPVSIRVVLESVLRNCDGKRITEQHVRALAGWQATGPRTDEIPFVVARVLLQDLTGVPLLVDLAAMRGAAAQMGKDAKTIEPLVPVDLVVDHSVQVDYSRVPDAVQRNMQTELSRNHERFEFLKWGMGAFDTFRVVPPGIGICHQVNLEYLARGVFEKDGMFYPDTLVGTDSHTTMINALGVVGWGVGGIEAEAGMLGQPIYILTPDVVGVHLHGKLREGVTATDLVLTVTEMLRAAKVVGKFVEFFGEGAASLSVPDRATIANMSPEYGATMGFFPIDDATLDYLRYTGRSDDKVAAVREYFKAQGMFGFPKKGECDYTRVLELDLSSIHPSVAGPSRPQDRIELPNLKARFAELFQKPLTERGYNKPAAELDKRYPTKKAGIDIGHGDILIAAITSCTNTSNPGVLLAAGLVARKAVEKGLKIGPRVKTSLAPGSRVVAKYLESAGLQDALDKLGFGLVGYGCTTCIGNSGPLDPDYEEAVVKNDIVTASVLSGNRNFEARIHQNIKANFLMSPPLVVAFALAGTVRINLDSDPLGTGADGKPVYLKDIWPTQAEVAAVMKYATDPATYRRNYADFSKDNPLWNDIVAATGAVYRWDEKSTYIQEPPFFEGFGMQTGKVSDVKGARALAIFGDSITTDHISPAGGIKTTSPAGEFLKEHGVSVADFNTYGARRGNHLVMMRGTFANVRIKNLMVPGVEGGVTKHQPDGEQMPIYDAAMKYITAGVPTIVFGGEEYGSGSSRDWAAKGTALLGAKAVVAKSFERIHRSNLVGMGVLPCQFKNGVSAESLKLDGTETFDLIGVEHGIQPQQEMTLVIHRNDGSEERVPVLLRIDTPIEVDYYVHGGILPFVLRELIAA